MVRASRRSGANSKRMVHWSTWSTNLECSANALYVLGYVAYRDVLQIRAKRSARLSRNLSPIFWPLICPQFPRIQAALSIPPAR